MIGGEEASSSFPLSHQLAEEDLRCKIQQCQRNLIRAQAETLAAEGQIQEAEESHQQELAVFCAQLDALDRHLQSEHQQQSEEGAVARKLLSTAFEQLGEMQVELQTAESETERIETESRLGRPPFHMMSADLDRYLRAERALESEVDDFRRAADNLRGDLAARHCEREKMRDRRRSLEEALEEASDQIHTYEHWSENIHNELRLAGSELREDQETDERERMRLEARAVELERDLKPWGDRYLAGNEEMSYAHFQGHQAPLDETDAMPMQAWTAPILPALGENSTAPVGFEGYIQPIAPLLSQDIPPSVTSMASWPPPVSTFAESQGLPTAMATPPRPVSTGKILAPPVGSPGVQDAGRQSFRSHAMAEMARTSPTHSALTSSPTVLWCRKVPSQVTLQLSPSVPTLV